MTFDEPHVSPNSRYDMNATCSLLGISRKTLLKYTVAGLIQCGLRECNGRRFYKGSDIVKFWKRAVS